MEAKLGRGRRGICVRNKLKTSSNKKQGLPVLTQAIWIFPLDDHQKITGSKKYGVLLPEKIHKHGHSSIDIIWLRLASHAPSAAILFRFATDHH